LHPVRGRPDTNAARPRLKLELSLKLEIAQASWRVGVDYR
jgi:hypothetical protein